MNISLDNIMNVNNDILLNQNTSNIDESKKNYSFDEFMKDTIDDVNEAQNVSNEMTEKLIKGEDTSMHEVMLKSQEAQMSMQLLVEFRNKIYDVYQELNKVQV